ncbi:hypothetical protein PsYK624_151210 [Phanerochaete sordida]|uniref:Extracellular membrane protein CFEM domain-containing protein n=1 Tax=Phanerochaete sordida TaxID=48140 RepID=A0A9P3GSX1_9APHY|nr:hypothetical protein PsYK624_151210 [Phanerochaete sordida]
MLARITTLFLLVAIALSAPTTEHVARQVPPCLATCLTALSTCVASATAADFSDCLAVTTCPIDTLVACVGGTDD